MAAKEQIRKIYAIGSELGIKGHGNDDLLHELVYGITGKQSIKELNDKEAKAVLKELYRRKPSAPKKPAKAEGNNGMATNAQQRYCWVLIYRLCEADPKPDKEPVERLIGAIIKYGGTNICTKEDPFSHVTQENCAKLIEFLKRAVNTAEKRALRRGETGAENSS